MKKIELDCEIIQDLLPLYEENCCSEQSKILVKEHLKECKVCQEKLENFRKEISTTMIQEDIDEKIIKKGMRKIKRIKIIGISVLLICLYFLFIIIPVRNYQRGSGITYANLKELYMTRKFMEAIKSKNYDKAYKYLNIRYKYDRYIEEGKDLHEEDKEQKEEIERIRRLKEKGFTWYDKVSKKEFIKWMQELEDTKFNIVEYSYERIRIGVNEWYINIEVKTENKSHFIFQMNVDDNGIISFIPGQLTSENKKIKRQLKEAERYIQIYYRMPDYLNEEILRVIYGKEPSFLKDLTTHHYQK